MDIEAECARSCTSGCHATDCEHHDHLPSPASSAGLDGLRAVLEGHEPIVAGYCDSGYIYVECARSDCMWDSHGYLGEATWVDYHLARAALATSTEEPRA